ncbi:hypothetical protein QWZ08_24815 [Ferruginibacter paludis]|uniref:hypothetical protein n=1 Tax=Ferruginibacter paludis TaxID=1310417 RepID=UPI0025B2F29A|nr:hypothetical protein [Ferruginibacter paludis]MDN3658889.1 hypothetical protein [Ferruginibacter paludis]
MKKFFQFFIALLLAFLLANLLYLFVLPRVDWEFKKTKEAHNFKDKQLNVIVFGNSTGMDGINPEILSEKFGSAYNFSVGGASLQTNYVQLSYYLQHNARPSKVLLFLSSAHTNYVKANDVNPIIEYYYIDSFHIGGLTDMPLFRFRWTFVENIKKLLSFNHRSAKVINGQLQIKRMVTDFTVRKNDSIVCHDNRFYNSTGYEYMWQMAALCREKGIQMEVFEMPCWKDVQNNCADLEVNKLVGNTACNLFIHNLNNVSKCDTLLESKKDWLSRDHLNYNGSIKITDEVVRILSH